MRVVADGNVEIRLDRSHGDNTEDGTSSRHYCGGLSCSGKDICRFLGAWDRNLVTKKMGKSPTTLLCQRKAGRCIGC